MSWKYTPRVIKFFTIAEPHLLIAVDNYSVVVEIGQQTDDNHPSDEDDIISVQEDFNRK